ncbi:unnamed protein product [Lymnaea stagnalis]|uniref:ETS domain-containing protein n=1 Tax=Lymnaea stagnalis TaxID=6523 RepID=A0AAV2H0P6_LYMST
MWLQVETPLFQEFSGLTISNPYISQSSSTTTMALGYDRPVTYGQPFNQNHFLHDPVSIKREPGVFDYVRKDAEMCSMEEPRMYFGKEKSVLGECELTSWINKHPKHWTKKEVLDWIFSVVESDNLDGSRIKGEAYRDFTGEKLYKMTKEEFENVDPNYGVKMYETFSNLVKNISFEKPSQVSDPQGLDDFNQLNSEIYQRLSKDILERVGSSHSGRHDYSDSSGAYGGVRCKSASADCLKVIKTDNDVKVDIPSLGVYSISQDIEFPFSCHMYQSSAARLDTSGSFLTPPAHVSGQFASSMPCPFPSSSSSSYSMPTMSMDQLPVKYPNSWHPNIPVPVSVQSSPARSSSTSSLASSPRRPDDRDTGYVSDDSTTGPAQGHQQDDDVDMFAYDNFYPNKSYRDVGHGGQQGGEKPRSGRKSRNNATKNGNHLWEFVRDLLRDPATNPKLLKWEDRENGVFRFLQSEAVAQLWGEKKNNPQMTYEKLSRAMRFCRSAGYFESVPKNGKFPKKLCFMFGGRAHGWKD